jgi:hypothetical protein
LNKTKSGYNEVSMPPAQNRPDKITYFAETDYRSKRVKFGIRDDDRSKHMYVIGKTGMGKSTLLENLAIQDIQNGEGVCFIDPHGGTAETLLSYVPEHRIKDVIYFAPFDQEYPVGLNVMEDLGRDKRPLVVSGLMGAFKKVWVDAWSARMEYILNNAMLALMETPGSTLLGVNRIFADKDYRNMIVANVTDPSVKAFWVDEYAKYSDKFATEATAAIQNKVGQFAANPLIRNLVGQPKSTFDIRRVMDEGKIFIVNLSKGRMGEGNANLVGSMLITKIYLAAMSRADVGADAVRHLPPFYLYVDEFQSFANESFADILSEARKYKLSLTIAHQYIEQMSEEVRAAVFGNVGTMISFRVGSYDAEVLEKEFAPAFLAEDIVNLGFAQIYLKLMINGIGSAPFSAKTLNRPKMPEENFATQVIDASHKQFALPRAQVEADIRKWHEPVDVPQREGGAPVPETKKFAPGQRPARPQTFTPSAPSSRTGSLDAAQGEKQIFLPSSPQILLPTEAKSQKGMLPTAPITASQIPQAPYKTPYVIPLAPHIESERKKSESSHPVAMTVRPIRTAPVIAPPTVHQPFKEKFAHINSAPTQGVASTQGEGDAHGQVRAEHPHMSLTSLKSGQKKDKGPSVQNLLSLKDVLKAVDAKGGGHGSTGHGHAQPEKIKEYRHEDKKSDVEHNAHREKKEGEKMHSERMENDRPENDRKAGDRHERDRQENKSHEKDRHTESVHTAHTPEHKVASHHTPKDSGHTMSGKSDHETNVETKHESAYDSNRTAHKAYRGVPTSSPLREIPEHVLRGVLSDE